MGVEAEHQAITRMRDSRNDRLAKTSAGFAFGGELAITSQQRYGTADMERVEVAPHEAYRRYIEASQTDADTLEALESDTEAANFPIVRAAAGWAEVEHAISLQPSSLDKRLNAVLAAQENFVIARDALGYIYDHHPEHWLVWPGTYWRYQLAIDSLPSVLALADQRDSGEPSFDEDLIEQTQANTRHTLARIVQKYRNSELDQAYHARSGADDYRPSTYEGRRSTLIGVGLEVAAQYLPQGVAAGQLITLPPSIRLDNAGKQGSDVSLHYSGSESFTGQVKKRVKQSDCKKYRQTNLICGVHHMQLDEHSPLIDTLEAIVNQTNSAELQRAGYMIAETLSGSSRFHCHDVKPRVQTIAEEQHIAV